MKQQEKLKFDQQRQDLSDLETRIKELTSRTADSRHMHEIAVVAHINKLKAASEPEKV